MYIAANLLFNKFAHVVHATRVDIKLFVSKKKTIDGEIERELEYRNDKTKNNRGANP